VEYCLPKTELLKTEVVSSLEILGYSLPQTEILRIEYVSSLEVVST
jgi:hypothetical protein